MSFQNSFVDYLGPEIMQVQKVLWWCLECITPLCVNHQLSWHGRPWADVSKFMPIRGYWHWRGWAGWWWDAAWARVWRSIEWMFASLAEHSSRGPKCACQCRCRGDGGGSRCEPGNPWPRSCWRTWSGENWEDPTANIRASPADWHRRFAINSSGCNFTSWGFVQCTVEVCCQASQRAWRLWYWIFAQRAKLSEGQSKAELAPVTRPCEVFLLTKTIRKWDFLQKYMNISQNVSTCIKISQNMKSSQIWADILFIYIYITYLFNYLFIYLFMYLCSLISSLWNSPENPTKIKYPNKK